MDSIDNNYCVKIKTKSLPEEPDLWMVCMESQELQDKWVKSIKGVMSLEIAETYTPSPR